MTVYSLRKKGGIVGGKASLPTFVRVQPEEKSGSHNE